MKNLKLIYDSINIIEKRIYAKSFCSFDKILICDSINFRIGIIGECLLHMESSFKYSIGLTDVIKAIMLQTKIIKNNYEEVDYKISEAICIDDLPLIKQKVQTFLSSNNETV